MSSVEYLREFVNERLTAAAEEIFRVFKKTIVEYEEEISRQRRLLDIVWKPEIKLYRIDLPQQHVCTEEEVLTDQQFLNRETNSSLYQEDPEPPQIKEEQEELFTSQEGEQLVVKQETDTFMLIPTYEESHLREPDTKSVSLSSHVAESQDQIGGKVGHSGSTRNTEPKPKKRHCKSHSNNVYNPNLSEIHRRDVAITTILKYRPMDKLTAWDGKQPLCSRHITSRHVQSLFFKTETMTAALVAKPNVTSPVWEHFGFEPNEKGEPVNLDEPVCKICNRKVPVKRGNTSNLRSHLDTYHRFAA